MIEELLKAIVIIVLFVLALSLVAAIMTAVGM